MFKHSPRHATKPVPTTQARYPLRSYSKERIADLKKNVESATQAAWKPTLGALLGGSPAAKP